MLTVSTDNLQFSVSSGFPLQIAADKIFTAYAHVKLGHLNGAEQQIQEGLAEFDAASYHLARGLFPGWLGETRAAAGFLEDALTILEEASKTNSEDELLYLPSLFWTRGKLNFRLSSPNRFEARRRGFSCGGETCARAQREIRRANRYHQSCAIAGENGQA